MNTRARSIPHEQDNEFEILNALNGGLIVLDRGARIVRWNAWMANASGLSEGSAIRKSLADVFPAIDLSRLSSAVTTALESNASTIITHALNRTPLPLRTRSGAELLHDITVAPIGNHGTAECLIFVVDVTVSARRERYLREQQNARYDAVVARAPEVIITVDEDGHIQFANAASQQRLGISNSALLGTKAAALFENHDDWDALWRSTIAGHIAGESKELKVIRADGTVRYFDASASLWKSTSRPYVTAILRDTSERRAINEALRQSEHQARQTAVELADLNRTLEERVQTRTTQLLRVEEALRQSQKMEAIGNLTGGIAHDFNNLLQVIGGNLQLLKREVLGNPFAEQRLKVALDGVSRSAKLSSQLLAFARRQPLAPKVINPGRFIREMEDILRKAVGEAVTVETTVAAGLWNTLIDPGNLENALLNLSINARDAMAGRGRLTIEASNNIVDSKHVCVDEDVTPGQYVLIAITDNGSGMPTDVIEHAFEPFFTTKPEGRGTGLGLPMVYGFVKQSGGHIKIYSEVGRGTTIKLYLPRSLQSEDRLVEIEAIPTQGGSETVLVAEDDEAVRETVVAMLAELGYRVLKAKDAQSALSIVETGARIDLLFTDVIMPGPLKSTELARRARERIPNLPVLFTSGYTEDAFVDAKRLDDIELLGKPYSREALARKLRQMLSNAAQRKAETGPPLSKATGALAARTLRILICEDDATMRDTTVDMLSAMDHQVTSASDAREALSSLKAQPVDILLTDTELPDMSGATLAEYATFRFPSLAVIFTTGRAPGPSLPSHTLTRTLVKPFSFEELIGAISSLARGSRE